MNETIKKAIDWLLIAGAIVWGGVALGFNLVSMLVGAVPFIQANWIYGAVGVAGGIALYFKIKKK